ncbi:MAG: hypothetical protein IJ961_07425 [Bacteroidales bacterium]|nr:hypothetical protein [Bacteroidales bacterium]MBR7176238.1 hypothetical protein [Bacteroidales bacterium]
MNTFFLILIPALVIMVIVFVAIGIKMFVKKDGQFERKCAHSLDPDAKCVCGGKGDGSCKRHRDPKSPSQ